MQILAGVVIILHLTHLYTLQTVLFLNGIPLLPLTLVIPLILNTITLNPQLILQFLGFQNRLA